MQSIRYTLDNGTVLIETVKGFLKLTAYSDSIVRVRYAATQNFSTKESLMIHAAADASVELKVSETDQALLVSIPKLAIQINKRTGAFTYLDSSRQLLTKEPARGGKTLTPVDVLKSVFDENIKPQIRKDADGVKAYIPPSRQVVDRRAFHTKLEFEWSTGEAIYGLGSHEEGMMNLRGQHQYLYQQNMKVVLPMLLSTRGYGVLLDSYSQMTFHDDAFGSYLWTEVDDELDYYFIVGPEFDQIVQGMRHLTGKAPMLPRWAFGYIQSKERYMTQTELIDIVKEYRARGLPLDCVVQDWKYWPKDQWGQKTLDSERYPDPDGLTADLHRLNARMMISVWPIMNPGTDNWRELREQDCLLGNQATYDAFQEKARELYWKQANEGLFVHGIDAWWCDCTEPFQADWSGAVKPEPEERMRIDTDEAKTYLDPEFINAYSLMHSRGIYEGQRKTNAEKRVVNVTRSAYPGQQRYSTITWSGDIAATWNTLRRQIADGLNFCVTGMPYWHLDIGAFFIRNDPKLWFWSGDFDLGVEDMGYRELYVRWFQFAAFLPMFRAHGTDAPREIWRFGNPGEPMYEALVKALRLRYRLMPYIYSLAGLITQRDYTMLRSLPFDFRADPATYDIADQFMFGPAFLVNPVTTPMYFTSGSTAIDHVSKTRPVYLPKGAEWYDFWTGQCYAGGQTIHAATTLDTMPIYVRSGSIVPLGPDITYADEQPNAALELRVYVGQDGRSTLYDDEGDNYNYERGHFAMIHLSWDEANRRLTLHERQGSYPGMPVAREFRIVMGDTPYGHASSHGTPMRSVLYEGLEISIDL